MKQPPTTIALFLIVAALLVMGLRMAPAAGETRSALRLNDHLARHPGYSVSSHEDRRGRVSSSDLNALSSGLRGYEHLLSQEREQARLAFAAAGWSTDEFLAMADNHAATDPARAVTWLSLAQANRPDDESIRLQIGRLCQQDWTLDPACASFLEASSGNHFVNAHFALAEPVGWSPVETEGAAYGLDFCDGSAGPMCAHISVDSPTPVPAAGLGQCFAVEPGITYRYGVWMKVIMAGPTGIWRPLYLQGSIDGEPTGNWPGDEAGSSEWRYWEREYVAQPFDGGKACFSPIRLLSAGDAWFRDAVFVPLTDGSP